MTSSTRHTDNAVCPHCGYVDTDSWELGNGDEGSDETECGNCEKPFEWTRNVRVTYSTRKTEAA